jgi:hypothetical protein
MTIISSATINNRESSELERLRTCVSGQVLIPADEGYDRARLAWNLNVNQHPAVIVIPQSEEDIVEAVRFADAQNLEVAGDRARHDP